MANEDRINMDHDQQIDASLMKLAEQHASCDRRSAEINDERAQIRANAEKLGIPSLAFQHSVAQVKKMSDGERRDYTIGVARMLRAIGDQQATLFPEEAERIRKREENAKPKGDEGAPNPDTNPRSNPKAGGAGKAAAAAKSNVVPMGGVKEGDALIRDVAARKKAEAEAAEQEQGAAVLAAHKPGAAAVPPEPPSEPKSQSALAAEKLAAAKLY